MNDLAYGDDYNGYCLTPQIADLFKVKLSRIILFFFMAIVVSMLSGIRDTSGAPYLGARVLLALVLAVSLLTPPRFGVPLFVLMLIVSPDLAQTSSEIKTQGEYNIASIWRLYLGPLRPSWIIAGSFLIQILKVRSIRMDKSVKRATIWFITVPALTGFVYGGYSTAVRSIEVLADVRYGLMLITSVLLIYAFLVKYPDKVGTVMAVFTGAVLGRHLCDLFYWIIGYGSQMGGVSRASVDSTKNMVVFALLLGIYLILKKKKIFLGLVISIISVFLIVVYGTRMIWLTSFICCSVLVFMLGARKAFIAIPLMMILVFGTLKAIKVIRAESVEALAGKAESFQRVTGKGTGNFLERFEPLRYGEIVNSINTSMKRVSILWGNGYGSYYTDEKKPFPRNLVNAHPEYAAASGKFYYCHNFLFQMLFKHGIIGMVIIYAMWLTSALKCYKYVFKPDSPYLSNGLLACIIAFVPNSIINMYWTGKGVCVSGMVIAILLAVYEIHSRAMQMSTYDYTTDMEQSQYT